MPPPSFFAFDAHRVEAAVDEDHGDGEEEGGQRGGHEGALLLGEIHG